MKKNFRKLGILTLTGMLALSQASTAFAATKQSGSGKSELSSYNAELATQRTKLSELISESKSLTVQITSKQKDVKTKGYITKSSSEALAKYSSDIKAKRQELTDERGNNKTLRAAAKEARMSGDFASAKDQLILLEAVQEKQIKIRTELVELLKAKLKYLNGMTGTITSTTESTGVTSEAATDTALTKETIAVESNTVSTAETKAAESNVVDETTAAETNVEAAATQGIAEVSAETTATAEQKEEIITNQAEIDAVLDDGAELEGEDF